MKKRQITFKRRTRDNIWYYSFMLLPALFLIVFNYIPMFGVIISFQDYLPGKSFFGPDTIWVGLKHFKSFFSSYYFPRILRNTIAINLLGLFFGFPIPIIFALFLNEFRFMRLKQFTQTVSYMPNFLSYVIIAGLAMSFVGGSGILTNVARNLGVQTTGLIYDPEKFWTIYTVINTWKGFGWGSVIYLSSIASIDPGLYEAAEMDGAGRFQKMRHVTMPTLMPMIVFQLIMAVGALFNSNTEMTLLLYSPTTYETADVIGTYLYRENLLKGSYSYGTAAGMVLSVMNLLSLCLVNSFARKKSDYSMW